MGGVVSAIVETVEDVLRPTPSRRSIQFSPNPYDSNRREEPASYNTSTYPTFHTAPRPRAQINNEYDRIERQYNERASAIRTFVSLLNQKVNAFYQLTMNQCSLECRWISFSNEVNLVQLFDYTAEYSAIVNRFSRCLRRENAQVIKIEKVQNHILMGQYILKREEYRHKGIRYEEKHLYHGTKRNNFDSICRNNFDRRLTRRNRFGKGVSFAPTPSYAIHYCDKQPNRPKVMFLVRVLFGRGCEGYEDMALPYEGFDTSMKEDGKVFVKYYDNEYYPEYLIHFTANIIQHNNNGKIPV